MDGSAMASYMARAFFLACIASAVAGILLWKLAAWIFAHVHLSFR